MKPVQARNISSSVGYKRKNIILARVYVHQSVVTNTPCCLSAQTVRHATNCLRFSPLEALEPIWKLLQEFSHLVLRSNSTRV